MYVLGGINLDCFGHYNHMDDLFFLFFILIPFTVILPLVLLYYVYKFIRIMFNSESFSEKLPHILLFLLLVVPAIITFLFFYCLLELFDQDSHLSMSAKVCRYMFDDLVRIIKFLP